MPEPSSSVPIPLDWCLDGRDLTEPRPSPDGAEVAVVVRWQQARAIVLVAVDGGPERVLTTSPAPAPGRGMGAGCFEWLPDGSGIVYVAVDGELWSQPLDGGPQPLTGFERSCRAPSVSPDGRFVVVSVDDAEIWLVDLVGTLDAPADGSTPPAPCRRLDDGTDAFCSDPFAGIDRVVWTAWDPPAMPWDAAHVVSVALDARDVATGVVRWRPDGAAVQQPRLLDDGSLACVHDASGWLNLHIGSDVVVAESAEHGDPPWGMGQRSFAVSPDAQRVAYARNTAGFGTLCVVERSSGRVTEVAGGVHGQLQWRGDRLVALRSGARTPTAVVVYDTTSWVAKELLAGPVEGWRHVALPAPEPMTTSAHGVTLFARRYAAGHGRLLCWVHGGPTDQWRVEFRPRIVYWWSRGWDVLVVDPRGTTGHGRAYRRGLEGGWGRVDVDDTAALIRDAHDRGWASPETTVVIGGSSGGLTVLGVLADHADLVAGGVTSSPVSDLADLATTTHRFEAHYTDTLVGDPDEPSTARRFEEFSPLHRADRIRGPLLLFHGGDDPVVPAAQSAVLVGRILAAGGRVDHIVYDGEGHSFRDRGNQVDEYTRTERFLDAVRAAPSNASASRRSC